MLSPWTVWRAAGWHKRAPRRTGVGAFWLTPPTLPPPTLQISPNPLCCQRHRAVWEDNDDLLALPPFQVANVHVALILFQSWRSLPEARNNWQTV